MTAEGSVPGYDFNNGAQGWTFSNSNSGRVTTPSCGLNASSWRFNSNFLAQDLQMLTSPVIESETHFRTSHFMHGFGKEFIMWEDRLIPTKICKFSTEALRDHGPRCIRFQLQHMPHLTLSPSAIMFNQLLPSRCISNSQIRFHNKGGNGS